MFDRKNIALEVLSICGFLSNQNPEKISLSQSTVSRGGERDVALTFFEIP